MVQEIKKKEHGVITKYGIGVRIHLSPATILTCVLISSLHFLGVGVSSDTDSPTFILLKKSKY